MQDSRIAQLVERVAVKRREQMADKRTYVDRREYLIKAVQKRRKEIRLKAIAYKGGLRIRILVSPAKGTPVAGTGSAKN